MTTLQSLLVQFENVKVMDKSIPYSAYTPIDLSVSNADLVEIEIKNPAVFEVYIDNHLQKRMAKIAFGGYNEERNLYKSSLIFNDKKKEERNIHLGMDFWIKDGTAVLAALDGTLFGFANNKGIGNYGPTIILKHHFENQIFYTLYGHLSLDSIENLVIGSVFRKGQQIATLGDSSINGGYPPHLHFQIIDNMGTFQEDYPGVCCKKDLSFYLDNCPDPNLLLKIL